MATLGIFYLYRGEQPLRCLIKQTTGVACPGCGSMRVAYALLEGRLYDALRLNALAVCAYVGLALVLCLRVIDEVLGTDYYARLMPRRLRLPQIILLIFVVLAYWYFWLLPRLSA